MPGTEERREFQRLELASPLTATFGDTAVTLVEIGVLGARIEHRDLVPTAPAELRFAFDNEEIALLAQAVRTTVSDETNGGYESGLRFLAAMSDSGDRLRTMLAILVMAKLESRATAPSTPVDDTVDGDKTIRGSQAAYICYRLEGSVWHKRRAFLPEQPETGFTVARDTDAAEVQRLCRLYVGSDEEGRRLIRLFAELSISDAMQIPPNRTS